MQNLFEFSPLVIGIVPVALGIVAAIKQVGLPNRFAPIASIVVGIGLVSLTGQAWQANIAQGIIAGLAASGLWSGVKTWLESTPPSPSVFERNGDNPNFG